MRALVDTDTVDPAHLEELAALLRERRWERAAKLAEAAEKPALGAFRSGQSRPLPDAPPGFRWNSRMLLEPVSEAA